MHEDKVFSCAKWFIDNNLDTPRRKLDGSIKLQKLLFFSQLISLVRNNKLLFENEFNAFENGMVMEVVRIKYRDDFKYFKNMKCNLTDEDMKVLNITKDIYGAKSASELSLLSHDFNYWETYFYNSFNIDGYKIKNLSRVPNSKLYEELKSMKEIYKTYLSLKTFNIK